MFWENYMIKLVNLIQEAKNNNLTFIKTQMRSFEVGFRNEDYIITSAAHSVGMRGIQLSLFFR